ncbi:hypothetical protein Egran_02235 [Elaphomyces granulatus]|uniref:Uncharacterized protein n=1 Tax=Elaphomyces granulatus TaxID=519963 RepID=A0A232M0W5_9EURO|nr:hypothetical protein Egran_02235 [Elaphomyces granulatus]
MSRQRILDWCKGWKSKSLEKMNFYVNQELEQARAQAGINLSTANDPKAISEHFRQIFTPEKFFKVFYWTKDILDFEKTSDLGKYFVKSQLLSP